MHPADIQAALKKKGYTQKALARELGKSEMIISEVINRKGLGSEAIRRTIAAKIGLPHHQVFAEFYRARTLRMKEREAKFGQTYK